MILPNTYFKIWPVKPKYPHRSPDVLDSFHFLIYVIFKGQRNKEIVITPPSSCCSYMII